MDPHLDHDTEIYLHTLQVELMGMLSYGSDSANNDLKEQICGRIWRMIELWELDGQQVACTWTNINIHIVFVHRNITT